MKNILTLCVCLLLVGQVMAQSEKQSQEHSHDHTSCGLTDSEGIVQSFIGGLGNIDFFSEAACSPLKMKCNFVFLTREDGTGTYPTEMIPWLVQSMNNRLAALQDDDGCEAPGEYPLHANVEFTMESHYIADEKAWNWYGRAEEMSNYHKHDFCPNSIINGPTGNWPYIMENVIDPFNAAHPHEFNIYFVENGAHLDFLEGHVANGTEPAGPWVDPNDFDIFGGCSRLDGAYNENHEQFIIIADRWTKYYRNLHFGHIYVPDSPHDNQYLANVKYWDIPSLLNHELGHSILDQIHPSGCNNLMDANDFTRNHLTKVQLNRLHNTLATSNMHNFVDCSSVSEESCDIYVTADETLNTPMMVFGDLIIQSGATFTVRSMIELSETSDIQLEAGARLIVDGGILTNGCGPTWRGIRVTGGGQDFDVQIINGATVENTSKAAVSMFPPLPWPAMSQHGNGVLQAENSFFNNTRRIAELIAFQPSLNNSYIRNCVQIGGKWSITNWNCIGVEVTDNEFNNITKDCIVTEAGSFKITGNEFNSVENDILFANVNPGVGTYIGDNDFFGASTGVRALGTTIAETEIIDNDFFTGFSDVFMDGTNNYLIEDNMFTADFGVVSFDNGDHSNLVSRNEFNGNFIGLLTSGVNDDYRFVDNCFSTSFTDARIHGSVTEFMGKFAPGPVYALDPANNCFTHDGSGSQPDIAGNPDGFTYIEPQDQDVDCRDAINAVSAVTRHFTGSSTIPCQAGGGTVGGPGTPTSNPCYPEKTKSASQAAYNYLKNKIDEIKNDPNLTPEQQEIFLNLYKGCLKRVRWQLFQILLVGEEYDDGRDLMLDQEEIDDDTQVAIYTSFIYENKLTSAANYLNSWQTPSAELNDFRTIQLVNLQRLANPVNFVASAQQLSDMFSISKSEHPYSGYAKAMYYVLTEEVLSSTLPNFNQQGGSDKAPTIYSDRGINVYPNPFSTALNINIKGYDNLQVQIYSLFGKLIHVQDMEAGRVNLNTSNWTNGMYVITFKDGDEIVHQDKLVLMK